MSSNDKIVFTKNNIDTYLREVAIEYRKQIGKNMPAEMILIGGASVLLNYGFRDMTTDIDAIIRAASAMEDVIRLVRDRYNLPIGWLNEDFTKTLSYSPKLVQYSKHYRTYSNVLDIRTISEEYLIAMKLRSGRQYKSDLSDILGILSFHSKTHHPITLDQIRQAVCNLYGDWDVLPASSQNFITNVMSDGHFDDLFSKIMEGEKETKKLLVQFEQDYPGITNGSNIEEISGSLQKKSDKASILALLRERKK